nr:hypothetical protein BaRGS_010244 [Batillaria attramentaria]
MCNILGGRMLEVESQAENDFIVQQMSYRTGVDNVWIGLQDFVREGRFVWISTLEPPTYTNWAPGEPNNNDNQNQNEGGQDCVQLRENGQWDDAWRSSTGKDFQSVGAKMPNERSPAVFMKRNSVICQILGGKMLEVESKDENDFVVGQLSMRQGYCS